MTGSNDDAHVQGSSDAQKESDGSGNPDASETSNSRWALLGLGGVLSLCCLFAPAAAGVAGGAAAGGTAAGLGGGVVQVAVTALTVGALAAAYWAYNARRASDA